MNVRSHDADRDHAREREQSDRAHPLQHEHRPAAKVRARGRHRSLRRPPTGEQTRKRRHLKHATRPRQPQRSQCQKRATDQQRLGQRLGQPFHRHAEEPADGERHPHDDEHRHVRSRCRQHRQRQHREDAQRRKRGRHGPPQTQERWRWKPRALIRDPRQHER